MNIAGYFMKIRVFLLSFTLVCASNAYAMMEEMSEYFPVSSIITREKEQDHLIKEIANLKAEKYILMADIEALKREMLNYKKERRAIMAIRSICKNQQQDEASKLLAKEIANLYVNEKGQK